MRTLRLLLPFCFSAALAAADPEFPLSADSKPQADVPKGAMIKDIYKAGENSVFPGTEREYQIYLPAGFDKSRPAPFMVFQDGVIYQAPVVFDNLIAKKDIPPLVGLFIKPGVVPAAREDALPRYNRSHEYDSVTNTYSQFLIDEVLPALEKRHGITFSKDPNDAAISGNSSGGICAFMAAWHRPDRFRRVFTGVGTYVGIHGADQLPVLVRKFEPRPLRVFLQSGTGDNNLYCGDWWMANQTMERSLSWAGYEVNHAWGEGGHNQKHASQIFPEVLRWLWKDWQTDRTVKANPKGASQWKGYEIFEAGTSWKKSSLKSGRYLNVGQDGAVTGTETANERSVNQQGKSFKGLPGILSQATTTLSPDQSVLYAALPLGNYVYSLQIDAQSGTRNVQAFTQLQPQSSDEEIECADARGMCVDADGRLYVATALGIQVCDQAGRVNFIIPTPRQPSDVCFGGKDLSELYISCRGAIYVRPTKVRGVVSAGQPPVKPAPPKL